MTLDDHLHIGVYAHRYMYRACVCLHIHVYVCERVHVRTHARGHHVQHSPKRDQTLRVMCVRTMCVRTMCVRTMCVYHVCAYLCMKTHVCQEKLMYSKKVYIDVCVYTYMHTYIHT
jgi:hypothetical protein